MKAIGLRQLRGSLGSTIDRAREGEQILVTDHGTPVAVIGPVPPTTLTLLTLMAEGRISGSGQKFHPPSAEERVKIRGGLISDTVSEMREDRLL